MQLPAEIAASRIPFRGRPSNARARYARVDPRVCTSRRPCTRGELLVLVRVGKRARRGGWPGKLCARPRSSQWALRELRASHGFTGALASVRRT